MLYAVWYFTTRRNLQDAQLQGAQEGPRRHCSSAGTVGAVQAADLQQQSTAAGDIALSSHEVGPHPLLGSLVVGESGSIAAVDRRPAQEAQQLRPPALRPPPPALQCVEGANDKQHVCSFHDIYLHGGLLYYVLPSAEAAAVFRLPRVRMRWMTVDCLLPGADWLSNRTMLATSGKALAALGGGSAAGQLGGCGLLAHLDHAQLWPPAGGVLHLAAQHPLQAPR